MELFILSFLVFAVSALGLAFAGLRNKGQGVGCGVGCACAIAKRTTDDEN